MTSPDAWVCGLLVGAAVIAGGRRPLLRGVNAPRRAGATRRPLRPRLGAVGVRRVSAAVAGAAATLVVGGYVGLAAGVVLGVVAWRQLGRLGTRADAVRAARLTADLPLAADLLAAALAAGAPTATAAAVVGRAVGGPLGAGLTRVARAADLGAPPRVAWAGLLDDPCTAALARPLVRAAERGAPAAAAAARVASDVRRAARDHASAAAEVTAVRGVGPLGLCFLPAFVLLGVVPLVAGSALALLRS